MGLMDKVKAQATVIAQRTQDTARDSKAKLDQAQARRRADAMLRDLGVAVYAERTGRSTEDTDSKIDKLVGDLAAFETEHGVNLITGAPAGGTGDSADQATGSEAGPDDSGGRSEDTGTTQV